ncbi:MAG: LamG domain-containing protein, partial [Actinobacteria bacterium]|nr:LamG domain-containing protein [Actinomycetota bacterium]
MTNGTAICESVKVGNHNETRYIFEWVEYELGTNLEVGNYEWKIEARRPANSVIDFIPIAQGIKLDEMAWWDNSWGFKRQINLTANVGNFSYMNLTYDSGMQSDLGDIRFVDCATESVEYNHTTENYTAEYFIERVHSLGANCLMMYYGNSGASSTSSSSNTHYQPLSYWFFDNDDFSDSIGANNGTNSGTTNLNGYIGDRRYFDGTGDDINVGSNTIDLNDGNFTILFKVNFQNVGTDNWGNLLSSDNSGAYTFGITDTGTLYFSKYGVDTIYSTAVINKNKNVTVGITYDTSANVMSWWINGTLRDTDSYGSAFTTGYTYLISSTTANRKFNGTIDEGAVFTKVLSASQMYEFHTYTTPTISVGDEQSLNQIMIYLNSPENAYNSTNATIDFNCSASDDVGLIWLNLSIDDSYVYNVTGDGTANLSLSYSTTLSQGNHNWTCSASDGTGINDPKTADARNLSIDSIIPTIFISAGNGTFDYGTLATNHTINYTITDTNLQSCWLNYNSTNTTIPCTSGILNTTNFTMQYNIYNGTLWANDTIGNYYGQAFSWNYNIFQGDIEYTTPIYEGQENTLTNSLFVSFPITSAYLVYENESYISQIISNATITTLINNIESEVNETKNNSFYWIIFYTGGNYSTITNYQEVIPIEINLCNSTYNTSFISAKLYDELNKTALTNGTIEYYFYINSYNT